MYAVSYTHLYDNANSKIKFNNLPSIKTMYITNVLELNFSYFVLLLCKNISFFSGHHANEVLTDVAHLIEI